MRFVVPQHAVTVLHPRVRGETPIAHTHPHSHVAPLDAVPLEHPVERYGTHEAQRAKNPELRGPAHCKRERFGAGENGRVEVDDGRGFGNGR